MAVVIDSWQRERGADCDHIRVTVTVNGQTRVFASSLTELRRFPLDETEVRQALLFIAGLRHREGRAIEGPVR